MVLHGSNVDDRSWAEWSNEIALLVSRRRLFFSWPGLSPERSLLAADAFISPLDGKVAQANSLVALRAGMLLLTNGAGHLPPEVLASQQVVLLSGLDEEACDRALATWLDFPDAERARIAGENRNWLDRVSA
jgi:hypothetical protein